MVTEGGPHALNVLLDPTAPAAETASLTIRMLGAPALLHEGRSLRVVNRKLLCMLGYLALHDDTSDSRERLVGLLWSESDEKHARGSLRQVVTALRRITGELGFEGFETDRSHVTLDPGRFRADVTDVLSQLGPDRIHPLLLSTEDLPQTLMAGCEDVDPSFAGWLSVRRTTLRDQLQQGLLASLEQAAPDGRAEREAARALLRLDPTQELAARRLMENLARGGDVAGALTVYKALWDVLDEEHDMEPAEPTRALVARIKSGDLPEPGAGRGAGGRILVSAAAAQPRRREAAEAPLPRPAETRRRRAPTRLPPLLVVGGFELRGDDADARMMLEGFRHALIGSLVRFREWQVAESDAAVARAEGPDAPARSRFGIRATAEKLGGDGLRVALTIRDIDSGVFVWSQAFALTYETWTLRQEALLRQATIALNVNLSADRLRRTAHLPEITASLHDLWLRGQSLILQFNAASWEEADRLLSEVTELAPDFAPAFSSRVQLGNTAHISRPGVYRSATLHAGTLELAQKAVALDPLDSRAQLALGWALAYNHRWEHALLNFELARDLNGHDPWTMTSVAQAWAVAGRHGDAMELARQALEATPLPNHTRWGYHASIRFFAGDYEGALEAARIAGDTHPNNGGWRAASLAHLGRTAEARAEARKLLAVLSERWWGETPQTPRNMARWVLQVFPWRQDQEWKRLRDGLRMAGLPVAKLPVRDVGP
ncbi:MAG: BTAD domain-containing putative transcriptional regulator [Albimonas sp.]|uniref:BTAD domain-containing putative transcriptional regulator n=1 Tax=Albimonas sp. TaxID=1872425 RepID=UPI00405720E0